MLFFTQRRRLDRRSSEKNSVTDPRSKNLTFVILRFREQSFNLIYRFVNLSFKPTNFGVLILAQILVLHGLITTNKLFRMGIHPLKQDFYLVMAQFFKHG